MRRGDNLEDKSDAAGGGASRQLAHVVATGTLTSPATNPQRLARSMFMSMSA